MCTKKKIPDRTLERLPLYYRFFKMEMAKGVERVSSKEISLALDIDSATIRKDFSHFGELGRKGYGYNISTLIDFFVDHLHGTGEKNVAVVGVGNLGRALMGYKFTNNLSDRIHVCCGFDIDPKVIGTPVKENPVYDMKYLNEKVDLHKIEIAILSVPKEAAVEVRAQLEDAGIKGILNFAPIYLQNSEQLVVHDVDLSVELQSLFFMMKNE